jgi:mono/diheme cytochrome c family protein
MRNRVIAAITGFAIASILAAAPTWADDDEDEIVVEEVEFTVEYMTDPNHIDQGHEIWLEQCQHCHGSKAYPGKAPKLKPRKYEPGFVFYRVTKGFKGMPPWKDVYTLEERMAVVSYVMSKEFSP